MDSIADNFINEDALKLYDTAKNFYDKNNYQKANIYLNKAVDLKPRYPSIYYLKGECAINLKDYKNALKTVSEGLQLIDNISDKSNDDICYQIKFLNQRYRIYLDINSNEKTHTSLEQIKTLIIENFKCGAISQEQYDELIQEIEIKVNNTVNNVINPNVNLSFEYN